jgi:hypothetical protein
MANFLTVEDSLQLAAGSFNLVTGLSISRPFYLVVRARMDHRDWSSGGPEMLTERAKRLGIEPF